MAENNLQEYRHGTRKIAFIGGMALGIAISVAGLRILSEIMVLPVVQLPVPQATLFHGVDILITGGLIGGGSEGIHKIIVLFTDFLDQTRAGNRKIKEANSESASK